MRLPRNAKIFRGQLDAAPFAGLSFLLLMFLVLQSKLVFTPSIRVDLPEVPLDLPGTANSTVVVAIDKFGQIYYESQAVTNLTDLRNRLHVAVHKSREPLTLEVQADRSANFDITLPVLSLASEAGFREARVAARPRPEPAIKASRK
jgi:biopolymer transport protein ExbD